MERSRPVALPRAILGVALTVLLAAALIIMGVAGGGGSFFGDELGGSSSGSVNGRPTNATKLAPPPSPTPKTPVVSAIPPPPPPPPSKPDLPVVTDPALGGSFPGVILWPEVKPVTMLVEPMPMIGGKFAGAVHPFIIPFGGEYWILRLTMTRPPRNSFFQRGTPARLSFSSTDHWPLRMEARQKLQQDINLSCCAKIQLGIRNADRYPGTIQLELFAGQQSLGRTMVTSAPDLSKDPVQPVTETLDFTVPPNMAGYTFGEFRVVYNRLSGRTDKSSKVSIERFVLVPRGMN
jgi:hypothetical protein